MVGGSVHLGPAACYDEARAVAAGARWAGNAEDEIVGITKEDDDSIDANQENAWTGLEL
jgi:hypothetical protein